MSIFPMKLGDTGKQVYDLNRMLAAVRRNSPLLAEPISKSFNEATQAALNAYKALHNLPQDGLCDEMTWHRLELEAGKVLFPFTLGDNGSHILALNRKLAIVDECKHFLTNERTSTFTDETTAALNAFKQKHGMPADGKCDRETWKQLDKNAGSLFHEVWQYELDALQQAKHPRDDDEPLSTQPVDEEDVIARAHHENLAGLAFSGGGIRSATFNLGILQALAEFKLLPRFDYLSTVSGGGYLGGWFSRWLQETGNINKLQSKLTPGTSKTPTRTEPEEIGFLRKYSNYLAPRTGLFSADTWALLATYFRNTFLNMTLVVALLVTLMAVPWLLLMLAGAPATYNRWFAWFGTGAGMWTVFYISLSISSRPRPGKLAWLRGQSQKHILLGVVMPLLLAAFSGSIAVWRYRFELDAALTRWPEDPHGWFNVAVPGVLYFLAWGAGWFISRVNNLGESESRLRPWPALRQATGHLLCAVTGLGVGTLLLAASIHAMVATGPVSQSPAGELLELVSFGAPYLLGVFGVAMILTIGLVGRMYSDKDREWWSRQGGWTAIWTLTCLGLFTVTLYGPAVLGYVDGHLRTWAKAVIASAWFGSVIAGVAAGRSPSTDGQQGSDRRLELLAAVAPPLFTVGVLLLVSGLTWLILSPPDASAAWGSVNPSWTDVLNGYQVDAGRIPAARVVVTMLGAAATLLLLAWRVDVNKFSLHMMYRNRLVRAYLGAINRNRRPHPFTGFDENDDRRLDSLCDAKGRFQRPLHLINTAVNLTTGKELAWQTRKAGSFTFSPAFCGFELADTSPNRPVPPAGDTNRGCYHRTSDYKSKAGARDDAVTGVSMGMAMAVSGAAVNPNMGYHSAPALAFLMTLFNVRLGRWFPNPLSRRWNKTSPGLGGLHLVNELFGMSDASASYLHLSDGGHFENLGIYELVRRRCKLIVAVDASADGSMRFEDLGNAIRKCSTDLHVDIDIDVADIEVVEPTKYSRAYCVIGDIRYSCTDKGAQDGVLLYIKPCLLGDERADIRNYKKSNQDFPHQSTADQFFDETQFESYRCLGYRVGKKVFNIFQVQAPQPVVPAPVGPTPAAAVAGAKPPPPPPPGTGSKKAVESNEQGLSPETMDTVTLIDAIEKKWRSKKQAEPAEA